MILRPPRSTLLTHSFPTRRSSDLGTDNRVTHLLPRISDHGPARLAHAILVRVLLVRQRDQLHQKPCGLAARSEEHTSELQSLMRISYAVFCLKKKKTKLTIQYHYNMQ